MELTELKLQKKGRIFSFLAGVLFLLSFFGRYTVNGLMSLIWIFENDMRAYIETPFLSFLLTGNPLSVLNFRQLLSFLLGIAGILLIVAVCIWGRRNVFLLVVCGNLIFGSFSSMFSLIYNLLFGYSVDFFNWLYTIVGCSVSFLWTSLVFLIALFCTLPKLREKASWMKFVFFVPAFIITANKVLGLLLTLMGMNGGYYYVHIGSFRVSGFLASVLQFFNPLGWLYIAAIFFFCLWMVRILPKKQKKCASPSACDVPQQDDSFPSETVLEERLGTDCAEGTYKAEQTAVSASKTAVTAKSTDLDTALAVAEGIKKYKELLDAGAITREEYDRIKKDLLGQ